MGFPFGYGNCLSPFWANPCLANAYVPTQVFGCGVPMSFPGFYDSSINRDMLDAENGHWNIKPNLMMETANTNALMFQVRNLKFNQYSAHPYFGDFCSSDWNWNAIAQKYLSPMPTIQQWTQANPLQPLNPINNNNNNINPNTGDPKKDECIRLRNILQQFKNKNDELAKSGNAFYGAGSDAETKINAALNKFNDSKATDDEKLTALKEALQYVGANYKDGLIKVLLSNDSIKSKLYLSGFNMSPDFVNTENDKDESSEINLASAIINELKNPPNDSTGFTSLQTGFPSLEEDRILRRLSYLNDKSAAENKSFIEMLVKVNENGKYKENKQWTSAVNNAAESLINKGIKVANSISDAGLKKKVEDAYGDLTSKKNAYVAEYDKSKSADFVKSFNKLYAMLRLVEAQQVQNQVKTDYGYLNNTISGLIDEDLVVKDTKTDLTNEKIGDIPTIDLSKISRKVEIAKDDAGDDAKAGGDITPKTAQERADGLVSSHHIDEVATIGKTKIYKTKASSAVNVCDPKFYAVTEDGEFVELKEVKSVDKTTGKCKKLDNTEVELKDVVKEEVSDDDVKNYRKLVLDLLSLTTGNKPQLTAAPHSGTTTFKGVRLFKSAKNECYMTVNNQLAKLKYPVESTGELKGTGVYIWEISASDESEYFEYVTKEDITGTSSKETTNKGSKPVTKGDVIHAVYAGYSMHYELDGNSNSGNYRNAKDEFDKFSKYTSAAEVASFIDGFNKASQGIQWSKSYYICRQIFTEEGEAGYFGEEYRKNAVKTVVSKFKQFVIPKTKLDTEILQKAKTTIEEFENKEITSSTCIEVDLAIYRITEAYFKQHPRVKESAKRY